MSITKELHLIDRVRIFNGRVQDAQRDAERLCNALSLIKLVINGDYVKDNHNLVTAVEDRQYETQQAIQLVLEALKFFDAKELG